MLSKINNCPGLNLSFIEIIVFLINDRSGVSLFFNGVGTHIIITSHSIIFSNSKKHFPFFESNLTSVLEILSIYDFPELINFILFLFESKPKTLKFFLQIK